jgi:hypothetical protein
MKGPALHWNNLHLGLHIRMVTLPLACLACETPQAMSVQCMRGGLLAWLPACTVSAAHAWLPTASQLVTCKTLGSVLGFHFGCGPASSAFRLSLPSKPPSVGQVIDA